MTIRKLLVVPLLFSLLLAACGPTAVPVDTNAPSEAATAIATETASEEPTTVPEQPTVAATATVSETVSETAEAGTLTGCPEPTADTQLISSPAAGYCFLIPASFERSEFSDAEGFNLGIYGPASTPGHRERAFVNVTEATTDTVESNVQAVVDDVVASLPGFTPTQSAVTLGGVPAIRLDNLPGQDINRQVYAVNEGMLYQLTFIPFEAERPDAEAEAEQLYALVLESFRFMPPTEAASSYAALLTWEGEIDGACTTLDIQPSGEAAVGVCGDAATMTTTLSSDNTEWAAVQQHFGNINAETSAGKIVFQGQGSAEGDAWAQALATWASFTAMEINAARSSASVRTTVAWQLSTTPEHSGLCSQLIVLAYGYAYANQIPCDGNGQSTQVAMGWLTDAELDIFLDWVENGARIESENGYVDAKGSTEINPEQVTGWANGIYNRMLQ